jgi:hypothetical protein
LLFWGLVVLRAIRAMRKGGSGSVEALVGRGVGLTTEREVDADKFYAGMMKNVNTVAIPELSDGEIAAARARRRQECATVSSTAPHARLAFSCLRPFAEMASPPST